MKLLLGLLCALAPVAPQAEDGGIADPRVRSIAYVADQVVPLAVTPGFAAVVEFAPDEAVDNVVVGNSAAWQVTLGRRGDRLVVKPLGGAVTTNMIVVTDVRRYVFLLEPGAGGDPGPFVLRFAYRQPAPVVLQATPVSATYRLNGDRSLRPLAISDDGQRTTISWTADTTLPAIFAVDAQGKETLVNGRMVAGDYLVEGIADRYVFRLGKAKAGAVRQAVGKR